MGCNPCTSTVVRLKWVRRDERRPLGGWGVLNKAFWMGVVGFLLLALFQLLLMFFAYSTALFWYQEWTGALYQRLSVYIMLLMIFLAVYLTLMWKELYAHNYHHYLRPAFRLLLKNLAIATLVTLLVWAFYLLFNQNVEIIGWKLTIFLLYGIFVLMLAHFLQYLWIHGLSRLGYF